MAKETIVRVVCDHPDKEKCSSSGEVVPVGIILKAGTYDVDLCGAHRAYVVALTQFATKRKGSKPRGAARIRANAPS